jgi:alpha-1,3-mannosyltransferase
MRIAQVARQFYPAPGGIQNVVGHLSRCLQADGHEVGVITLDRLFGGQSGSLPSTEIVDGIHVRRIPFRGPRQYAIAPGVLGCIRDYDLVHVHSGDFFLDYLAWTRPLHRRPLVITTHGMYFHTGFARRLKRIYFQTVTRLSMRAVSQVICDSEQDLALVRAILPADKVRVIPNGIDYERFVAAGSGSRDPNLLLAVGRLADNKRYDRMLRAFALVAARRQSVRLVIVGPDWGTASSLAELSAELGLTHCVKLAGQVSDAEMQRYLSTASVWLSSSAYESFGVALLEAMAAGCVPVAQPLPAFAQLLGDGSEGFYADFDSPDVAAVVIGHALSLSSGERQRIVASARHQALQFSWSAITRRVQEVYRQVVNPHEAG